MQSFWRSLRGVQSSVISPGSLKFNISKIFYGYGLPTSSYSLLARGRKMCTSILQHSSSNVIHNESRFIAYKELPEIQSRVVTHCTAGIRFPIRHLTTVNHPEKPENEDGSVASTDPTHPQRIKFKRLDKTARHIMNILDKEEVDKVRTSREIPDIKPGYIVQLKVEVPENKRRVSSLKGIVIARRNAGLHTTFRLRRMVAGVGVESVFPLYSPNIKEMKVLDKKNVRRAKLYYLRDRMNALKHK